MPNQPKKVQKKLDFIRHLEYLEKASSDKHSSEYEVIAFSKFIGSWKDGPYSLMPWDYSEINPGIPRTLILKTEVDLEFLPPEERELYPLRDNLIETPIAIVSLIFRTPLELGTVVRDGDTPIMISGQEDKYIDEELFLGTREFDSMEELFELILNIKEEHQQKFLLSVKLYHQALLLVEKRPDLAYLLLISAIEVLSNNYDIGEIKLPEINRKLANLIEKISEEDIREEITNAVLKLFRFHQRRFVKFIIDHLTDEFWNHQYLLKVKHMDILADFVKLGYSPSIGKVTPNELPDLLKNVYEQRSRTLHGGEPFPKAIFNQNVFYEEMSIVFPLTDEASEFQRDRECPIPRVHFFERLVNHVLKNFIKGNQT